MRTEHTENRNAGYKETVFGTVGVWITGMFAALISFGTFKEDVSPLSMDYTIRCSLGFAIASALTMLVCRLVVGKLWGRKVCLVVSALTALMTVGIAVNMAGYLHAEGTTWGTPDLGIYSDSDIQYNLTRFIAAGEPLPYGSSSGFPTFEALFFRLFGPGVFVPLLFNAFCMSVSAAICGRICALIVPGGSSHRKVWVGALLFAIVPSIPYYGAMFMKEAPVTLGFTLQAWAIAGLYRNNPRALHIAGAIAGAVLLVFIKPHIGYLTALGTVAALAHQQASGNRGMRKVWIGAGVMLFISVVTVFAGKGFRASGDFVLLDTENAEGNTTTMITHETLGAYGEIVGDYYTKNLVEKAAYLPMAAVAQYFPPFPWHFTRDTHLARFVPVAHLSVLWYIVGGLVLAYFVLCFFNSKREGGLRLWGLWWLVCYLGIAYMSAGTVARYYIPLTAACVPLAVQVLACVRSGLLHKKTFAIYSAVYSMLVIIALIVTYNFINR